MPSPPTATDTASHNDRRCPWRSSARERSGLTAPQLRQACSRRPLRTSPPPAVATRTRPAPRPSSPACEGVSAVAPPPACTLAPRTALGRGGGGRRRRRVGGGG